MPLYFSESHTLDRYPYAEHPVGVTPHHATSYTPPGMAAAQPKNHRMKKYILITQCLQNDFFYNEDCKLCLPHTEVSKMLVGNQGDSAHKPKKGATRVIGDQAAKKGPLGLFLNEVVGSRLKPSSQDIPDLHVINIRDYHLPGKHYDDERVKYGRHCEAGTDGVLFLNNYAQWLSPSGKEPEQGTAAQAGYTAGKAHYDFINSNSLFDFACEARVSPDGQAEDGSLASGNKKNSKLETLLDGLVFSNKDGVRQQDIYIMVVGVYTDLKVQLLMAGLKTNYPKANLAVSDTLTVSASLERHIAALDFCKKVLGVEVIHGLKNAASFLGAKGDFGDESKLLISEPYAKFSSFYLDKQGVLISQNEQLKTYVQLSEKKSEKVYNNIKLANTFLTWFGMAFLAGAFCLGIYAFFHSSEGLGWSALIGGIVGLMQVIPAVFFSPMDKLTQNLKNLVMLRMVLESHSLKTALSRYHLTTPTLLNENINDHDAQKNLASLSRQLEILDQIDQSNRMAFERLGMSKGDFDQYFDKGKASPKQANEEEEEDQTD